MTADWVSVTRGLAASIGDFTEVVPRERWLTDQLLELAIVLFLLVVGRMSFGNTSVHRVSRSPDLTDLLALGLHEHRQQDDPSPLCDPVGNPSGPARQVETELPELAVELSGMRLVEDGDEFGEAVNMKTHPGPVSLAEPKIPVANSEFELNLPHGIASMLYHSCRLSRWAPQSSTQHLRSRSRPSTTTSSSRATAAALPVGLKHGSPRVVPQVHQVNLVELQRVVLGDVGAVVHHAENTAARRLGRVRVCMVASSASRTARSIAMAAAPPANAPGTRSSTVAAGASGSARPPVCSGPAPSGPPAPADTAGAGVLRVAWSS